ncbi:molecular chaperone DnaJ [Maribrevibacterium harenarium]|uniref:Molecular chaperone DnaJ n=1 Tax=Maribrevibacterium harenarium TaxID=2589817 RepID=A0A501X518_9GAMM|nr:J domain-containing protein [Maribrevibacterium harenarium]TPE55640.1 molecular chaperone DnaJ [Maribrevibacterium harenarium]
MSLIDDFRLLELPTNATEQDAKTAYRRLARRYHPDKNPGMDTTEHFQRIQDAYRNVLAAMKQSQNAGGQANWRPYEFTNTAKPSQFDESGYEFATDAQQRRFVKEQQRAYQEMKRNSAQQDRVREEALRTARNTLHERRVKALYEEMQKHQHNATSQPRQESDYQAFYEGFTAAQGQFDPEPPSQPEASKPLAETESSRNVAKMVYIAASYLACFGAGVYSTLFWLDSQQPPTDNASAYISGLYPQFREGQNYSLVDASLYSEPSADASEVTAIPAHTNVQAIKLQGDWLTLRYGDITGWAKAEDFAFGSVEHAQQTGCYGQPGLAPDHGEVIGKADGTSRLRLLNQLERPSLLHFESLDGQAPFAIYLNAAQPFAANFIPRGRYRLVLETGSLYHGACQHFLFENRSRIILDDVDFASTEQTLTLRAAVTNP